MPRLILYCFYPRLFQVEIPMPRLIPSFVSIPDCSWWRSQCPYKSPLLCLSQTNPGKIPRPRLILNCLYPTGCSWSRSYFVSIPRLFLLEIPMPRLILFCFYPRLFLVEIPMPGLILFCFYPRLFLLEIPMPGLILFCFYPRLFPAEIPMPGLILFCFHPRLFLVEIPTTRLILFCFYPRLFPVEIPMPGPSVRWAGSRRQLTRAWRRSSAAPTQAIIVSVIAVKFFFFPFLKHLTQYFSPLFTFVNYSKYSIACSFSFGFKALIPLSNFLLFLRLPCLRSQRLHWHGVCVVNDYADIVSA